MVDDAAKGFDKVADKGLALEPEAVVDTDVEVEAKEAEVALHEIEENGVAYVECDIHGIALGAGMATVPRQVLEVGCKVDLGQCALEPHELAVIGDIGEGVEGSFAGIDGFGGAGILAPCLDEQGFLVERFVVNQCAGYGEVVRLKGMLALAKQVIGFGIVGPNKDGTKGGFHYHECHAELPALVDERRGDGDIANYYCLLNPKTTPLTFRETEVWLSAYHGQAPFVKK